MRKTAVALACLLPLTGLFPEEMPQGLDPDAAFLAKISGLFEIEDPSSIYDFNIRDKEVEFILDGTWAVDLSSALHISLEKDLPVYAFAPPIFAQRVNLSSWVFLDNTWYFESSFAEEFTRNTVAAGYVGNDDTVIKHVRAGNSGIVFPDAYPFVQVGGGAAIAPGIMGTFAGKTWNADAVVRYDTAAMKTLMLSGMNEVTDTLIPITSPVRGKWFVLPEAPVTGSVSVFVEDDTGTHIDARGRKWRELSMEEFRVSGVSGILELDAATSASVAVVYGGSYALSAAQAGTGLVNFVKDTRDYFVAATGNALIDDYLRAADAFIASIDGRNALLVRERGYFSPFEALFRYAASGSDLDAVYEKSGMPVEWLTVDAYNDSYAEITVSNADGGMDYIRAPEARFPLARAFPLLYYPAFGGRKIETDLCVRSRNYAPVSTISLGEEAIAGTIQVTRNGVTDTAFRFEESSGTLSLASQPKANETIRITWLDTDQSARNATLTLAGGIKWKPLPSIELSGASAFRWNTSKSGYTDSGEASPGSYVVSSGISWTGIRSSASTAFDFDITVPDTTDYYRILGMDSSARAITPAESWYTPVSSSISPVLGKPHTDLTGAMPVTLDGAARVDIEGTNGKTLPTITDSSVSGAVLSISCALPSAANWAGANVLAGTSGSADFQTAQTVSIALRNPGGTNDFSVFLQLGIYESGSYEDNATIRSWQLPTPPAGGGWKTASVQLTNEDRRALTAGKELRLIVLPSGASSPTAANPLRVRLYSGPLEITDTDFGTGTGAIRVTGTANPADGANAEGSSFETVINRFSSGAKNTVLKAGFTPVSALDAFTLDKSVPAIPLSSYNQFSFFVFAPIVPNASDGSVVRLKLGKPRREGTGTDTACEFELGASTISPGAWHRITVDLENGKILKDGSSLTENEARIIKLDRSISPSHIDVSFEKWPINAMAPGTDEPAWTVYLDELFLQESNPVYTGRNETNYSWQKAGPLVSAGKTPLVSDASFSVRTSSSVTAGSMDPVVNGSLKGGISLLRAQLSGSLGASSGTEKYLETTSHTVLVPIGPLTAKEGYSIDIAANSLQREESLAFTGPIAGMVSVSERHGGLKLERNAGASISPMIPRTPLGGFSLSADSSFTQSGITPIDPLKKSSWGDIWIKSLPLLLSRGEGDADSRKGMTGVRIGWNANQMHNDEPAFGLTGVMLDASGQSLYASHGETGYGSIVSFKLTAPVTIITATLTPEWNRTVEEKKVTVPGGTYFTDTNMLAASFGRQRWLYSVPPVADLFRPDMRDTIRDDGTWSRAFTNQYGLGWKRPSEGLLSDLYIPSTINASIQRKTETDASADNARDLWSAPIKAGFQALNIAGSFGVLRLFSWYEQDEIDQLYGWTPHWSAHSFVWSVDTWHSITLFFRDQGTVSAENTFHYDSPDIADKNELTKENVKVIWKRKGTDSFVAIPLRKLTDLALTTRREDSASVTVTVREKNTTNFAYDHLLATGIGKNGELRLSAGTGCTVSRSRLDSIDFRLGIGGKLTY